MENSRQDNYEKVVKDTIEEIKGVVLIKGKEYHRNNNPFHNFEKGAQRTGQIRERVIDSFLLKHEISISDMVDDLEKGILPTKEMVNEKFNDNIIYLLLKKASILERLDT
jgi:hypothetical protein